MMPEPLLKGWNYVSSLALLQQCIAKIVDRLHTHLPDLGRVASIAATAVNSFANPNRSVPTDPDAAWGVKHSARAKGKDGEDFFFGYKLHMIADAKYGLPLSYTPRPAMRMIPSNCRPWCGKRGPNTPG